MGHDPAGGVPERSWWLVTPSGGLGAARIFDAILNNCPRSVFLRPKGVSCVSRRGQWREGALRFPSRPGRPWLPALRFKI